MPKGPKVQVLITNTDDNFQWCIDHAFIDNYEGLERDANAPFIRIDLSNKYAFYHSFISSYPILSLRQVTPLLLIPSNEAMVHYMVAEGLINRFHYLSEYYGNSTNL